MIVIIIIIIKIIMMLMMMMMTMVLEVDALNIYLSRVKKAQAVDEVIFHDLATDLVMEQDFRAMTEMSSSPMTIRASEIEKD